MPQAVILDVDGTLLDSHRAQAEAWRRALQGAGFHVPPPRIAREIGKDYRLLLEALVGAEAAARQGPNLLAQHDSHFVKVLREGIDRGHGPNRVRLLPGVRTLLSRLRERQLKLALATGGSMAELQAVESAAVTDLRGQVDVVVTGDDPEVREGKPAVDLVALAVRRLEVPAAGCVMIGDTPWDAEACRRAGVTFFGLRCSGWSEEELKAHGARAVWEEPAELARYLDRALRLAR